MLTDSIHFLDYLQILRKRKWTIIVCFLSVLLVVLITNARQKPVFQTQAEVLVDRDQTKLVLGANILAVDSIDETYVMTQERIIRGKQVAGLVLQKAQGDPEGLRSVVAAFDLGIGDLKGEFSDEMRNSLIAAISSSVSWVPISKTRIFLVRVSGHDGQGVAYLANSIADAFVQNNEVLQQSSSQQAFLALTSKLQELKDTLSISEFALKKVQLEMKLMDLMKVYEERHPEVIRLRGEIESFSAYLTEELDRVREALGKTAEERGQRENVLFSYLASEDSRQGKGVEARRSLALFLEQEVRTNREMYYTFFKKLKEMSLVNEQMSTTQLKVVQRAGVPSTPIRPNKRLNLLFGCLIGLVMGLGLAFFQDYLDNTIRKVEDISKYLHLMVLTIVYSAEPRKKSFFKSPIASENQIHRLMTRDDPQSQLSEAFRTLRTNILLASVDKPIKTLAVTSSGQKEGKSTTAINLAISVARAGSRVILVDADLRRPILAKTFGLKRSMRADMVSLLTGAATVEEAIYESGIENLSVLPCSQIPPNPAELLGSKRMFEIIDELRGRFDLVVFDSAPIVPVTDTVMLSTRLDGLVFVVGAGKTPRTICMEAKQILDNARVNILGAVLNGVELDEISQHSQTHYRYYSNYAGSPPSSSKNTLVPR